MGGRAHELVKRICLAANARWTAGFENGPWEGILKGKESGGRGRKKEKEGKSLKE